MEKEHDFQKDLKGEEIISRLAYMSDILGALIHFNLSYQGPNGAVTEFISNLGVFVRKLDLWMKNVESKRYGMFELLTTLESKPKKIARHLSMLKIELKHYFPYVTGCAYIANPFSVDPADLLVGTEEQEELIVILADEGAKDEAQGMLSYKLLGEHGHLASKSRCSQSTDCPLYVGVRAGVLSHADHQVGEQSYAQHRLAGGEETSATLALK